MISFLIESSRDLQVIRTAIIFWASLIFWTDQIILMRVTCPLGSHRHIVGKMSRDVATLFFIRSSSNLQIRRIGIKFWISSILAKFQSLALELLNTLEGPIDFRKCYPDDLHFILNQILHVMRTAMISCTSLVLDRSDYSHESYLPFSVPQTYNGENV